MTMQDSEMKADIFPGEVIIVAGGKQCGIWKSENIGENFLVCV
jgi:hypothetical protein